MIFWCHCDISKYQAFRHLVTSKPTFEIMKSISIFWYYHDILILSWYIKVSSPSTLSHIQANILYHDIGFDILILPWWYYEFYISIFSYHDILILSWHENIKPHKHLILWYRYRYFDIIMIFWYYHDISKYQAPIHLVTSRPTFDIMISVSIFW